MKNTFILTIVALVFLTSCAPTRGGHYLYTYRMIGDGATSDTTFSNSDIEMLAFGRAVQFNLRIKNKSNSPIRIIWDDASLIDRDESRRLIHTNVKFNKKDEAQLNTHIPVGSFINEIVLPADRISYTVAKESSGWTTDDMLDAWDYNRKALRDAILARKGEVITLYLPIEKDGQVKYYRFGFEITDVKRAKVYH